MKWGFPISISVLIWSIVGLTRFVWERMLYPMRREYAIRRGKKDEVVIFNSLNKRSQVAICLPAKNEAVTISQTITSLKRLVPKTQIYIVSDGSTDATEKIARAEGCNVLAQKKSSGKALALERLITKFKLLDKYAFILFVDADTEIDKAYVTNALHVFKDPEIVAIAGYAKSKWTRHFLPRWRYFFVAHRFRLYYILQMVFSYGQTWKYTNMLPVIPGFASMYRTDTLRELKLAVPGLIIEDFNMAFQVQKKKLGKIAHHPSIYGTAKDPTDLDSYINQVRRWNIGFFQTIRKYGVWTGGFWVFLGLFLLESFLSAFIFSVYPLVLIFSIAGLGIYQYFEPTYSPPPIFAELLNDLLFASIFVFVLDYILTLVVSIKDRKPMIAFYGIGFLLFRILDSIILFSILPRALFSSSTGTWTSPKRT